MVRARRRAAVKKPLSRCDTQEGLDLSDGPKIKDCKLEFKGHLCHSSPPQAQITQFFTAVPPTPPTSTDSDSETVSPHHKIQLVDPEPTPALTLSPSGALSRLTLSTSKKNLLSPRSNGAKSRRRLNPSQTQNQQSQMPPTSKTTESTQPAKSKTTTATTTTSKPETQHKLTEYFPVRRSNRRPKKTLLEEHHRSIEEAILSEKEEGLQVHHFPGKGRGIVATREFMKGEFVVEYAGELIDITEAKLREQRYASDQNTGCYMYYFKYRNQQHCIDATAETPRLGRLVNHSRQGNLQTRTVLIKNKPHLVLVARSNITLGEEVLYDYGDRSKESLEHHPWLAS